MFRSLVPLAIVVALAAPAAAQESVYKKGLKSTVWVVQVVSREGSKLSLRTGSGSVIDAKQKLILTNYHVVEEIPEVTICFPQFDKQGKLIPERDKYREVLQQIGLRGKVIAKDRTRDLAVIQLPKETPLPPNTPALKMAHTSPETGDHVHSIGSPGVSGALFNYTDGAVKSVYHKKFHVGKANESGGLDIDAKVIESSSSVNGGDSGGPLMNDKAELIGVAQSMLIGANINSVSYFIDVSEVKTMLKNAKLKLTTAGGTGVASETPKQEKPATTAADNTTLDLEKKEEQAASKLTLAKSLAAAGKPDKAAERYKDIIKQFPGTKAADEAKALLEKM